MALTGERKKQLAQEVEEEHFRNTLHTKLEQHGRLDDEPVRQESGGSLRRLLWLLALGLIAWGMIHAMRG